jgi:hypothetical protein
MSLKGAVPGISKTGEKRRGFASPEAHVGPQAWKLFLGVSFTWKKWRSIKSSWLADGELLVTWVITYLLRGNVRFDVSMPREQ